MLKSLLKIAAVPLALLTAPALATDAPPLSVMIVANPATGEAEPASNEAAIFEMFAKLFDTGDKTPIDPAQLALGQATAAALLPEGIFGQMMDQMMGTFLKPLLELTPGLSASTAVTRTGMEYESAEKLTEVQLKAIEAIIDPQRKERESGTMNLVRPMMVEVGKLVEPPMREGIARAYARKFNAAQLTEVNGFFATPTGKAFAATSFSVQFDPEVLSATMQAMPMMMTKMMGDFGDLESQMKALPQERKLSELSAAELDALGKLVGRTPTELTAHAKDMAEMETATEAAAIDTADTVKATETRIDPWFDRTNWSAEDTAKVELFEAQSAAIMTKQFDAEEQAIARAKARLEKKK